MMESRAAGETVSWPVRWSAIWIGALAALAVGLIFGLIGIAIGAYREPRIVSWHTFNFWALVLSVCGAFSSSLVGAGRPAGFWASAARDAMLHGAVAWLVTIPVLLVLAASAGRLFRHLVRRPRRNAGVGTAALRRSPGRIIARNGASAL